MTISLLKFKALDKEINHYWYFIMSCSVGPYLVTLRSFFKFNFVVGEYGNLGLE